MWPISTLLPADFPPLLKEINDPPKLLYKRGQEIDSSRIFLAVVGARKYSAYGKEVCEQLISSLRGEPVTVVSGLALGIDGIAHRAALSAGLRTIAVPGSGLDEKVLYPSSNGNLAKSILESGGTLLSEYKPDFRATEWSFPQRNRIMAGLSHAVLIIEATKKSGTLITGRLATEYNRDVLAVPGSIYSANSEGPHLLIRLGATPITSTDDLRDALNLEKKDKTLADYSECSGEEMEIIEILHEPLQKDEIVLRLKKPVTRINATLSLLEIKGLVLERNGEIRLIS